MKNTKRAIIQIAQKLFSEKSYHKVSMDELAKALNLKKPTIYYYFKGKKELFFSIWKESFESLEEYIFTRVDKKDTPYEKLEEFIKAHLDFIEEHRELFLILYRERFDFLNIGELKENLSLSLGQDFARFMKRLREVIEEGQKINIFKTSGDPLDIAYYLLGIIYITAWRWLAGEIDSLSSQSSAIKSIFTEGLFSQEDRR